MTKIKSLLSFLLLAFAAFTFNACKEDDPTPDPVVSTTISNLAADPSTGFDPNTGAPIGTTGKFALFSFKTGAAVANTDSATNKWDLGFRGTTIIVNSPTSGPGTSVVQIVSGIFDELNDGPTDGYKSDDKNATVKYAIPTGSGNGWYTATGGAPGTPTIIKPIAGKIIVVKTADNRYAKMEILSYYKDAPSSPTGNEPARYYSFRYVYQPNDTKSFK
ncbi:MAG: HmuY family protein [Bacteroidia bacterium]|nr:HmuY family protein [Bacteroidia bacterium]